MIKPHQPAMPGAFDLTDLLPSLANVKIQTLVLYTTLSNTTKKLANQLVEKLPAYLNPILHSLDHYDLDQLSLVPEHTLAIFILPSYNVESPVDSVLAQFRDAIYDFRFSKDALGVLSYGVIGVGHADYGKEFCKQAKELDGMLEGLGARRVLSLGTLDVSVDAEAELIDLVRPISELLPPLSALPIVARKQEKVSNEEEEEDDSDEGFVDYSVPRPKALTKADLARRKLKRNGPGAAGAEGVDIEDLGAGIPQNTSEFGERKEMVSPMTRKSLTKQGYAIIGSHSAVKTCRWTKASLRGRGFCYKYTFYGIQSHRCMEATPSLACANKCTFCWRSHTNPVGTSWRWKTDDAEFLVEESLKEHDRLIKQLLGMPGVRPDRFLEARTPKHVALSLVGEPVMYPHIKKYIKLLTEKRISTFLVTNAQFPDSLLDLPPVTQLYLSIDAGNKDSLKSIDRPLHRDFWERFLESIDIVRDQRIRTVFRLTLVMGENNEEVEDYAKLVIRGKPDFIEVKGVTFCGYAASSNLTMKNSPYHAEVVTFVQALCHEINRLNPELGYDLASEHAHSCCVLAAQKKYYVDEQWNTWIDYDRFFDLVESGRTDFNGLDYAASTPDFAIFGAPEAGFSPEDQRWYRKSKNGGVAQKDEEE
ncbi:hypothetical protein CROQUDRAFT_650682 [Cronartium quercuum f. sp. fusiforme G11]|uniref:tRNA 4-demethylwyosine synthase (AdoMet-dependent) n=1 Tax=Cronartium quercuum f. sp. fusiforme G11 TaxID=708437 RepID=A0A9P6TH33_9BASI|nr:hypothetical protein CROQUDRAFT_650682 [Cronartium quercuum f. sp. fusiforme G11]